MDATKAAYGGQTSTRGLRALLQAGAGPYQAFILSTAIIILGYGRNFFGSGRKAGNTLSLSRLFLTGYGPARTVKPLIEVDLDLNVEIKHTTAQQ